MGNFLPYADLTTRPVAQIVAAYFGNCAILGTGSSAQLKCWGLNSDGQLGNGNSGTIGDEPNELGNDLQPVALGTGRAPRRVSAGPHHACAVLDNNTLKCWGYNGNGQLGYGDTTTLFAPSATAVNLGTGRTVHPTAAESIAAGSSHTCVLLDTSQIKCWGYNGSGQLGYGNTTDLLSPPSTTVNLGLGRSAKAVVAAGIHTCAILDNNSLKCWGYNATGALGIGNTTDQLSPPATAVNLGTGRTAKAVATKSLHTCAWLDNDAVKCWGDNSSGQLGLENTTNLLAPASNGVNLGTSQTVIAIAAGGAHSCALLATNQVKCWGQNFENQLGTWQEGSMANDTLVGNTANEMGDFLATVFQGAGRHVKALTAGDTHTCFLLDTDQVRCAGSNSAGQLGQGTTNVYKAPTTPAGLVDLGTDP
jgi:alpha-tubulin suppressor-like RCC1 family protein